MVIRCELDALPIEETNVFEHRSQTPGVSHKCGHDGHMAILAGVALWLKNKTFEKGKVVLLFQPAEETGKGAHAAVQDPFIQNLKPDYFFALHNLPGEALHDIVVVDRFFSASVQSVCISLQGKQSHASEPEHGINPARAMAALIEAFASLNVPEETSPDFALLTPVHLLLGEKAYGISAGSGELHYTVRTWDTETLNVLKSTMAETVHRISGAHGLLYELRWFDEFPASVNHEQCNQLIRKTAVKHGFTVKERQLPFKFGEDFGWYSAAYPSAMFGLGSGEDSSALHHHDYDFPDEIAVTGIAVFAGIIEEVLG